MLFLIARMQMKAVYVNGSLDHFSRVEGEGTFVMCLAVTGRQRFEGLTKGPKALLVETQRGFEQSLYSLPTAWPHPEVRLRSLPWACQHHTPNQRRCPLALQ